MVTNNICIILHILFNMEDIYTLIIAIIILQFYEIVIMYYVNKQKTKQKFINETLICDLNRIHEEIYNLKNEINIIKDNLNELREKHKNNYNEINIVKDDLNSYFKFDYDIDYDE